MKAAIFTAPLKPCLCHICRVCKRHRTGSVSTATSCGCWICCGLWTMSGSWV